MAFLQRFVVINRDLGLIYLSSFLWGVGLYLYFYLQPLYITQLGATPEQVGLALGIGTFVVTFLYAPIGLWADRYGRKQVMLLGWGMGTLATFAMAFAPDWRWFIPGLAGYTLSNFGVAVLYGYISTSAPPERRGEAFATVTSVISLGSIISPAIGGWLGEQVGLRTVYFVAALIYTASTLALLPLGNQPVELHATHHNARGLLQNRAFLLHTLFVFALFFAVDVGLVLAPKFLEEVRGMDLQQIGWLGTWGALGVAVLAYTLSKLRGEGLYALLVSLLLAMAGLLLLIGTQALSWLGFAFFISGGNRLVRPVVLVRAARLLEPSTMSFGMGLQQTAMQVGLALSPAVAGFLYARNAFWPFYGGLIMLGAMVAITLFLALSNPLGGGIQQGAGERVQGD